MTSTNLDIDWLLSQNDWVQRLARRLVGEGPDADDLAQETWTRALRSGPRAEPSRGWLATIVHNIARERFRARERRRAREEFAAGPESDGGRLIQRTQLRRDLLDLVLSLPEPERTTVVLRTIEGLSYEEVAREQGTSVVAARKRTSRAIARLREKMDASPGGRESWAVALAPFLARGRALPSPTAASSAGVTGQTWLVSVLLLLGAAVLAVATLLPTWRAGSPSPLGLAASDLDVAENVEVDAVALTERGPGAREPVRAPRTSWGVLELQAVASETGLPLPEVHLEFQPDVNSVSEFAASEGDLGVMLAGASFLAVYGQPLTFHTDERGRATLHVGPHLPFEATVVAREYGYRGKVVVEAIPSGEVHELEVAVRTIPDLEIAGRVLDADSRTPVPGARVSPQPQAMGLRPYSFGADNAGRFEGRVGSWRELRLYVSAPGFASTLVTAEKEDAGAIEIELHAAGTLRGAVLGAEEPTEYSVRVPLLSREVPVGPGGGWEITGLPPHRDLSVSWLRRGAVVQTAPRSVVLQPGEVRRLDWHVGRGSTISGRATVAGSGEPLAGRAIWLVPFADESREAAYATLRARTTTTDAGGSFTFVDVRPGAWSVGLVPSSLDAVPPGGRRLDVPEGSARVTANLEAHRGLFLSGKVVDSDGAPIFDQAVRASLVGSTFSRADSTDPRHEDPAVPGGFRIGPLLPGTYRLSAAGDTVSNSGRWLQALHGKATIEVEAGAHGIVLQLPENVWLGGVVVDAGTGEPVPGAVVRSHHELDRGGETTTAQEAWRDGQFLLQRLEPGPYRLYALDGDRVSDTVSVVVGLGKSVDDLELSLREGASLAVRYGGTQRGVVFRVESGPTDVSPQPLAPGETQRVTVLGGRYTLRATIPREGGEPRTVVRALELFAGEETVVEFDDESE